MNVQKDLIEPLHTALTGRFPTLEPVVHTRDYAHIGCVTIHWNDKRYAFETPSNVDWRANDWRWWMHKFTDVIARKTGL